MCTTPDQQSDVEERVGRQKKSLPGPKDPHFLVPMTILCETLNLPLKWVRRETSAGRLPAIRVGQRVLYNVQAVREFLRNRAARKNQDGDWIG
jgi:excisionase family DNA binding protein